MNRDEIAERRAFLALGPEDEERLRALRPLIEENADAIVTAFYDFLKDHARTAAFLADQGTVAHLAKTQREYLLRLFSGSYDEDYVAHRMRIGAAHQRIGLAPEWYLGAYRRYLELLLERVVTPHADAAAVKAYGSLLKLVFFDIALAMDAYVAAESDARLRQAEVIRELSTPVIELDHRLLLVPLVGTIDDERGDLLMETVLLRVTERSARVLIIDISGVGVVDTATADRLVKTAAAVRLLGGEVIVSGLRPEVARTLVELGFEVGLLETTSRLSDAVALARTRIASRKR